VSSVLIVDDNADQIWLARHLLELEGHECSSAQDAQVAWASLIEGKPDVVLLDLHLGRDDGWALLERMRADPGLNGVPVVIMSASHDEDVQARAEEFGARFLDKTTMAAQLLDRVRSAIAER
jgi:CheY-like chemotaxis protein